MNSNIWQEDKQVASHQSSPDGAIKIKILKNGPYLVTGGVPLSEKIIKSNGKFNIYSHSRDYPKQDSYSLCRCGHSANPPYCDGAHIKFNFKGEVTASQADYAQRAYLQEGPNLDLMDDNRCALARFCYRNGSDAWELTEHSDDPENRREAIQAAIDCPTGRLSVYDKAGNPIEPEFDPAIEILQDSLGDVSGPIYVKGGIPIESADGDIYEIRNRVALCRCGHSNNKPFCDAAHVTTEFHDRAR